MALLLASAIHGQHDAMQVWDLNSLARLQTLTGHKDAVRALKMANGKLFSGSYDGSLRCWNTSTLECEAVLERHTGPVRTLTSHENLIFSGALLPQCPSTSSLGLIASIPSPGCHQARNLRVWFRFLSRMHSLHRAAACSVVSPLHTVGPVPWQQHAQCFARPLSFGSTYPNIQDFGVTMGGRNPFWRSTEHADVHMYVCVARQLLMPVRC
jgi:hypothetical protein